MSDLLNKKCVSCEGGILPFDISEIHKFSKRIDGWDVKSNDKKNYYLEKNFKFQNFIDSQKFVNKIGYVAELEGHHPDIYFGQNRCRDGAPQVLLHSRFYLQIFDYQ